MHIIKKPTTGKGTKLQYFFMLEEMQWVVTIFERFLANFLNSQLYILIQ